MSSARCILIFGIVLAALLIAAGCTTGQPSTPSPTTGKTTPVFTGTTTSTTTPVMTSVPDESWKKVQLETNMGTIVIALDPSMPITAGNFETLVKAGYYDGVIFH
ncbi:MAG TPA: peptidylprolyl isomerase, partial [Methanoregulaceae archaeon]|nr:peptidylprolyl isomerase [Methanoregulaceae archaeon]